MKKNRIRILLWFTCLLVYILFPVKNWKVQAKDELPDLSKQMTMTASLSEDAKKRLSAIENYQDKIVYDLYKVAEIKMEQGVVSYELIDEMKAFSQLMEDKQWDTFAQEALVHFVGDTGSTIPNQTGKGTPQYTACTFDKTMVLEKGIYLLVARGVGENETVVTTIQTAGSDYASITDHDKHLVTTTQIGNLVLTATPQIISVPNRYTLDNEWMYHQELLLKTNMDETTGSILIEKTLDKYYANAENATFVFQVDTYYPTKDELYQSEVYAMQFQAGGTRQIMINGLPIGAVVKIKEIYSGINYDVSLDEVILEVTADRIPVAGFSNIYNGKTAGGGGITNYFKYEVVEGKGAWSWMKKADNTSTANGFTSKMLEAIQKWIKKDN